MLDVLAMLIVIGHVTSGQDVLAQLITTGHVTLFVCKSRDCDS